MFRGASGTGHSVFGALFWYMAYGIFITNSPARAATGDSMKAIGAGVLAATMVFASTAIAQEQQPEKAADNMQILMDKVRADKKLLVANNMKLTEEEAKGFWPVYDAYQKELQALNARYEKGLKAYAEAYKKHLPHADLKWIKDCGHLPMFEKETEFVETLVTFAKG